MMVAASKGFTGRYTTYLLIPYLILTSSESMLIILSNPYPSDSNPVLNQCILMASLIIIPSNLYPSSSNTVLDQYIVTEWNNNTVKPYPSDSNSALNQYILKSVEL